MIAASLPDLEHLDLEAAKALLIAQHATYTATLSSRTGEIERLTLLVEKLQRMLFGTKSEKVLRQIEQLELQLEELQASSAAEEHRASARAKRPLAAKPFRRPLPEHLPREIHTHIPDHDACPDCGSKLRQLGEDAAEMLEYVRASFQVIRHVRPKLSCVACDRIVQAPAPSRPIDRGLAGPGLLAHVLVSKYADHQPLYRQSEIYAREGIDLDRSTLAGWVGATSDLLTPLVEAVRKHVLTASKLHADDTPVPVLAPGTGKTKTGRLWTYVRDDRPSGDATAPAVWFAYSPDRKGEHPKRHLESFEGTLQADAYAGFHHLYDTGSITEAACWAHARRKFHEIHVAHPSPTTTEAIERIAALYAIEKEIRAAAPRSCEETSDRQEPRRCSQACKPGLRTRSRSSRRSPTWRRPSATRSRAGVPSRATSTTAHSRSTATPLNVPCASWPSDERTSSSPAPMPAENAPPRCTRCSAPPSSTDSTRRSTSSTCSSASQIIPSAASDELLPWNVTLAAPVSPTHS